MDKPTIMIVDDCEIVLEVTKHLLEEAGFHVVTRSGALGTTAAILKEEPDCVLMDVSMPALSGTEIVKLVKEKCLTTVLLFSAKEEDELRALVADCGADGYIKKGTHDSQIAEKVRSVMEVVLP